MLPMKRQLLLFVMVLLLLIASPRSNCINCLNTMGEIDNREELIKHRDLPPAWDKPENRIYIELTSVSTYPTLHDSSGPVPATCYNMLLPEQLTTTWDNK
eukprot:g45110.t1